MRSGDAFRAFNKSKSGFLSYKELKAGLVALKISHSEDDKEIRRLLDRIDIDRDGKVCGVDFRNFLGLDDATDDETDKESDEDGGDSQGAVQRTQHAADTRSWRQVALSLVLPVYLPGMIYTGAGALAAPTITLLAVELGGGKAAAGAALSLRALASLMMQVPAARLLAARGLRQTMFAGGAASAIGTVPTKSFSASRFDRYRREAFLGLPRQPLARPQLKGSICPLPAGRIVAHCGGLKRTLFYTLPVLTAADRLWRRTVGGRAPGPDGGGNTPTCSRESGGPFRRRGPSCGSGWACPRWAGVADSGTSRRLPAGGRGSRSGGAIVPLRQVAAAATAQDEDRGAAQETIQGTDAVRDAARARQSFSHRGSRIRAPLCCACVARSGSAPNWGRDWSDGDADWDDALCRVSNRGSDVHTSWLGIRSLRTETGHHSRHDPSGCGLGWACDGQHAARNVARSRGE